MSSGVFKPAEAGLTLAELLVAMVVVLAALTIAVTFAVPGVAREGMRGAVYDVQTCLQLARVEATTRNRDCRCAVDTNFRSLRVLDTNGTADPIDDLELHRSTLPSTVAFGRPNVGPLITLAHIDGTDEYHAVFSSQGGVTLGQGEVYLFGGDRFGRVSVFGVGATHVERWDGAAWIPGS